MASSDLKTLPEPPPIYSPVPQILNNLAEQYRSSNSVEEKVEHCRTLKGIIGRYPGIRHDDLRPSGLPEEVLQTVIETRCMVNKGPSNAALSQIAIETLSEIVRRLWLFYDAYGCVFARELLRNLESITSQSLELAAQPRTILPKMHGPAIDIIHALFSNGKGSAVVASPAAPVVLQVLLQALLTPMRELPFGTPWPPYKLLAYDVSGTPVEASGHSPQTILEKLEAEAKKVLSQYPAEYVVRQMTQSVGGIQGEDTLQDFFYIVRRFLIIDQRLEANLLRRGRLHIPMVNAWWREGRLSTRSWRNSLPPDHESAGLSWEPFALRNIDELISVIESPDIQRQVFRNLVNEADLVYLLGRVLGTHRPDLTPQEDPWYSLKWQQSVIQRLAMLCQGDHRLINGRVQKDWLYVGERLAAVARSSPITDDSATSLLHQHNQVTPPGQGRKWDILDQWSLYARDLGLELREALEKDSKSRRDAFGGDVGCHWVRCPLYGGDMIEFGINVFRCTGCRELPEIALEARYPSVNMPDREHAYWSGTTARRRSQCIGAKMALVMDG